MIPNQTILINIIPLLEAKDSSEIENIVTTTDKLFQHAQGDEHADHATKEALRYRTALYKGVQSIKERPLCTGTTVEICQTIKGVDLGIRATMGTALKIVILVKLSIPLPVGQECNTGIIVRLGKIYSLQ